jgi:hypothetical protein
VSEHWQKMETAPKDGTEFLMVLERRVVIGKWYDLTDNKYYDWSCDVHKGWCWEWDGHSGDCDTVQPTHWMPLPKPPEGVR